MGSQVFQSIAVKELFIGKIKFSANSNGDLIIKLPDFRATTKRIQIQNSKGGIVQAFDSKGNRYKRGTDKKV